MSKWTTLVISSGSIKGLFALGALHWLNNQHLLGELKYFIGTSVGAIIVYLILIGYTPLEMLTYFCTNDITNHFNTSTINIHNFLHTNGLFNFNHIALHLESLTIKKLNKVPTLKELFELCDSKLFICVTYDLTKQSSVYLNHLTHPNLNVIDALRMSASIPLIFEKVIYNKHVFIDGAVINGFPVKFAQSFLKKHYGIEYIDQKILAIVMEAKEISRSKHRHHIQDTINWQNAIFNLIFYVKDLLSIWHLAGMKKGKKIKAINGVDILRLNTTKEENEDIFDLNLNSINKINLFQSGSTQAQKWFLTNKSTKLKID